MKIRNHLFHAGFYLAVSLLLSVVSSLANANANLEAIEKPRIMKKALEYMLLQPETVTASIASRSKGTKHDFYSEGDYWWPNPEDLSGPYIRRDGQSNPENFIQHRLSMIRLSEIIGTLASAYLIKGDIQYVEHAAKHLNAWFVDKGTKMHPSLKYGQAIKGRHEGRSIGLIDTLHLVEVARGAKILMSSEHFPKESRKNIKNWFATYLDWMNTHPYGQKEREHPNNHGVCWSLQAAAFADLIGNQSQLEWVKTQFKEVYVKEMMDKKGGFPAELARTKPYGYSLFVLDAMAAIAQLTSDNQDDLWKFQTKDGRGMKLAMEFISPYIEDKTTWPLQPDVLYWHDWPVRHPSLIFASEAYDNANYLNNWLGLEADPTTYEVLRNLPIRHPLLWMHNQ
jgi:hypothetical protein